MKFREGEDVVIVRSNYKCNNCGENHDKYYHGGQLDGVKLNSQGRVIKIDSYDKLLLRLKDGREWWFHPDELDFLDKSQLSRLKRMIKTLPRHPIFEIAEQTPVFLINEKAYSVGEGDLDGQYLEKKGMLKSTRQPLVEIGDFASLDDLVFDRAASEIERIGATYAKEVRTELNTLRRVDGDLDIPQLIYRLVFPYLQDGKYQDRVAALIDAKEDVLKVKKPQEVKVDVTKRLEELANEALVEVNNRITKIENEDQTPQERTQKQKRLDSLFEYHETQPVHTRSLIGRAAKGKNIAIMQGRLYDVASLDDKYKIKIGINGEEFKVVDNSEESKLLEERFLVELGKKVRIDALREHFSRDKIIDLLRTQNAELLAMAGRKEYQGEGFGFTQDEKGNYYAYLDFPAMAIKSEVDENYYLYDKAKIALMVSKNGRNLNWDRDFFMVDNNGHPYVHNKDQRFAKICQGDATYSMPTSGKDVGEVIVKRLRKMKEVLMFGYTWIFFDPAYEGDNYGKNYTSHRRDLSELQKMNIPIIVKEELIK